MVGEFPRYRFAGWLEKEEMFKPERLDETLHHPAYAATQLELWKDDEYSHKH